jgi:hypothetical protein
MTKGGFFMPKKQGYLLLMAILCFQIGLTGCGRSAPDAKPKVHVYASDGLLGTTGANPNIPTNPSYHTYAMDKSLVQQALRPIKGIRSSRITFRGPNLYVSLDLDRATDIETAMQIKHAALDAVSEMMPRYRVKVNVGKNKLMQLG